MQMSIEEILRKTVESVVREVIKQEIELLIPKLKNEIHFEPTKNEDEWLTRDEICKLRKISSTQFYRIRHELLDISFAHGERSPRYKFRRVFDENNTCGAV